MNDKRKLEILESIVIIAQDSAESGNLDQSLYADVFEFISSELHALSTKGGATA